MPDRDRLDELVKTLQQLLGRPDPVLVSRKWVPPPGELYVVRADRLYVRSRCSQSSITLSVAGRFQHPNGEIIPFNFPHTPNSDRTAALTTHELGEGFLRSAVVLETSSALQRGECFVELGILRGVADAANIVQVLARDYVSQSDPLAYPGGPIRASTDGPGIIRSVTGTDPAAGAEVSETVPTDVRWKLWNFWVELDTDGTGGNRDPLLILDDGANEFFRGLAGGNMTSNVIRQISLLWGAGSQRAPGNNVNWWSGNPFMLLAGYRIRTSTTALAAGDNYTAPQLIVEEWIED